MSKAIGLIEFNTTPKGMEAADAMLKASEVQLVFSSPICPGKYITILAGEVDAVRTAISKGEETGGLFVLDSHVLPNVHPSVIPALTGTGEMGEVGALGAVETICAVSAVQAGDVAAKAANVRLLEIRLARGLGGKGILLLTGDLGSVESSVEACRRRLGTEGGLTGAVGIPSPHKALVSALL